MHKHFHVGASCDRLEEPQRSISWDRLCRFVLHSRPANLDADRTSRRVCGGLHGARELSPRQVFATLRFDGAHALLRQHHARVLPLYQRVFGKRTREC